MPTFTEKRKNRVGQSAEILQKEQRKQGGNQRDGQNFRGGEKEVQTGLDETNSKTPYVTITLEGTGQGNEKSQATKRGLRILRSNQTTRDSPTWRGRKKAPGKGCHGGSLATTTRSRTHSSVVLVRVEGEPRADENTSHT